MAYVSAKRMLYPLFRGKFAEVSGGEHLPVQGPYLLAANHIDYLDGFYIATAVFDVRRHNIYFLTKTSNYWWTRATIPIDPRNRSSSVENAFQYLRQGKIICNFIEGARNPESHLLRGKTGTAHSALLAKVPVIPVGMIGPAGRNFAESLTNLLTQRKNLTLRFGPAIDLSHFQGRPFDYETLTSATREIMRGLVPLTEKVYAA